MNHLAGETVNSSEKQTDEKPRPKNVYKKSLTVKHNRKITKFKLRTRRYLLTYKTTDNKVVKKILSNLPSGIEKTEVKRSSTARKARK